jgi:Tfp pilus assembly protein PilF
LKESRQQKMKRKFMTILLAALVAVGGAVTSHAQIMGKVAGTCTDQSGKAIAGATVEFVSADTGQKYVLKTDKSGKFSAIGISLGKYKVSLIADGKVLDYFNNVPVHLNPDDSPTKVDFDLAKEAAATGGTPEQQKQAAELLKKQAAVQQENAQIAQLNVMLTQASAAMQASNFDQAITILTQATTESPSHDLLWARLGDANLGGAAAAKDKTSATDYYVKAMEAYKKAVELKPTEGRYHNNLGQAYAKSGHPQEALAEYTTAAQADPADSAIYYFNLGAILTNEATGESNQATKAKDIESANAAFDKAIAAKPDYSEAYYQKGINLLSKATIDKSGKMVAAPGTAEAFNKYLEIEPTGKHAEEAKGILASLGETVTTRYKKTSK